MNRYKSPLVLIMILLLSWGILPACTTPSPGKPDRPRSTSASSGLVDHASTVSKGTPQTHPAANESSADKMKASYILDIKGTSNQLTPQAWKNMQNWRRDIVSFTRQHADEIFLNGPNKKRVALTFDDGPDEINTPAIIDALERYQVKGSFFFVGSKVKQHPDIR